MEIDEKLATAQESTEIFQKDTVKRGRGRPPKIKPEIIEEKESVHQEKKPRGRPKKSSPKEMEKEKEIDQEKRGKGRPKIIPDENEADAKIRRNKQRHEWTLRYRQFLTRIIQLFKEGKIVPKNIYWKNKILELQKEYDIKVLK
jgi:hypothetical protein